MTNTEPIAKYLERIVDLFQEMASDANCSPGDYVTFALASSAMTGAIYYDAMSLRRPDYTEVMIKSILLEAITGEIEEGKERRQQIKENLK